MSRKSIINLALIITLVALLAGTFSLFRYYSDLPAHLSQHETIVVGQSRFVPGSEAALRVVVRDSKDGKPLSDAQVDVTLRPKDGSKPVQLFTGKMGSSGTAQINFHVPADASRENDLVIQTRSKLGTDTVERPVTVERDYRVLLTTDKPIYQPGQVIHVRGLALSTFDLRPAAGLPLEITIADGKGNKVYRQALTTSEYGVAFTDFQLASEVNTGDYKITATLGNTTSEKTVTVEHYVLPKFDVKLSTEQDYYQPGQHVRGTLHAAYFFGKPVSESSVKIEGFTFDVQRNLVVTQEGSTDADGNFTFEFDLPAYMTGSDLESGQARFYLQASVIDQTQHTEVSDLSLPVASSAITIQAVPEGGAFRQGIENILYVLTSTPDGRPAPASLTITFQNSGKVIQAQTGEYGLAEVPFTPDSPYQYFIIQASDASGSTAQREFQFDGEWAEESVLLRPERPVYTVGETMKLAVLTSQPTGTVYLDIVRDGQTVSTRAVDISGGKADVAVDLTPDLYGTLELHAYKILASGTITRDTRLVVVSQAQDLTLQMQAGQETYRPGDSGTLNLKVSGKDGAGVQSAVGLAIVDESVFALAETDPGFAKLYFLLEKEILEPRYDLHGYSVPDMLRGVPALPGTNPQLESAANAAAQASLSDAVRQTRGGGKAFSLVANSHQEAVQNAQKQQSSFFSLAGKVFFAVGLLLALSLAGVVIAALWREKNLRRSLLAWAVTIALIALFIGLVPPPNSYFDNTFMGHVQGWLSMMGESPAGVGVILLLACVIAFVALIVVAARRKDALLGWMVGLLPLYLLAIGLLVFAANNNPSWLNDTVAILALLGFFLIPAVLLLRMTGFLMKRRMWPALMLLPMVLFPFAGMVPLFNQGFSNLDANRSLRGQKFGGPMMVEQAMALPAAVPAPMAAAGAAMMEDKAMPVPQSTTSAANGAAADAPRLRQYFPETMLWLPDAVTNPDGSLQVDIPVADSITTWRMTAIASSQDGRLGSAAAPMRVFQDFFIDLDLPLSLTVGDEVAIPVGVFNYLPEEQTVRLELQKADWFELKGEPVQQLKIAANDISVAYFRIHAVKFGSQPFKVTALGSKMSDAIQKEVRVYPDGKEIRLTRSDRLTAGKPAQQTLPIPAEAVAGTQKLQVKIYPGILSQVVEGLDSMLRMPSGCFEQTSSTTYPNLLVMDYLKTTKQAAPEAQMKAEEYINLGYQRLTTFEVAGGGFSLFGQAPADRMLTAYGLQEFSDMSRVHDVDPGLVQRAAAWLYTQQSNDGSWENDRGLVHENTWSTLGNDRLPVTAYITWSLIEAGFGKDAQTQKGLQYVREFQEQAKDPYVVGLVANALVSADLKGEKHEISASTAAVLDRLAAMAQREGEGAFWKSGVATFMGSEGETGSIETTALAALALLRSERQPEVANAALVYLVQQKDSFGTWHSTQATVLTLKALLQSVRGSGELTNANVTITLNGGQAKTVAVTPDNFDVVQSVVFDDVNVGADNTIEIRAEGKASLMYQVTGSYYLPWSALPNFSQSRTDGEQVKIDVSYDRTELAVNDSVTESVSVQLNEAGASAEQAMIDLGIPPGFSVQTEDLDALVTRFRDTLPDDGQPKIQRYELTGRQILIYVTNLKQGSPLEFSFRLKARFPLNVQTPSSSAYDYYNPDVAGEAPPQQMVVNP